MIPFSKLFSDTKERVQCFVSTLAMGAAGYLIYWGLGGDWHKIGMMYGVPLLVFNAWITLVTYLQVGGWVGGVCLFCGGGRGTGWVGCACMVRLDVSVGLTMHAYIRQSRTQHHDEDTIVFEEGEWNYVKGALQTIDREYGMGIDGASWF